MKTVNSMNLKFLSRSCNEAFARCAVAGFLLSLDPLIEEMNDIKTAVSEAVTNAIVHGYKDTIGFIYISVSVKEDRKVVIKIKDKGCGIPDIEKAMEPLFTTGGEERSGLGFSVMDSVMDKIKVTSKKGKYTTVTMERRFSSKGEQS